MSDLTARDIHQLDQAAVAAAGDVDALADDPETTLRLADRGPAVYAAQLTADLAAAAGERPMTLAAFAAWQTIRRVQERAKLHAEVALLTQVRALIDRWNNDRDAFPDGASPVLDDLTDILGGAR